MTCPLCREAKPLVKVPRVPPIKAVWTDEIEGPTAENVATIEIVEVCRECIPVVRLADDLRRRPDRLDGMA